MLPVAVADAVGAGPDASVGGRPTVGTVAPTNSMPPGDGDEPAATVPADGPVLAAGPLADGGAWTPGTDDVTDGPGPAADGNSAAPTSSALNRKHAAPAAANV